MIRVAEVFGPTIQGEGPSMGRPAAFVRLSGCNLDCAFCDTPHTWDWTGKNGQAYDRAKEMTTWSADQVVAALVQMDTPIVVITGGEPMTQQSALVSLVDALNNAGVEVEVETNGTVMPSPDLHVRFNVSPKLGSSGCDPAKAIKPDALRAYRDRAGTIFKFVIDCEADVLATDVLVEAIDIPAAQVWVMPQGKTAAEVDKRMGLVAEAAIERGWNVSGRLHVSAWGDRRGV